MAKNKKVSSYYALVLHIGSGSVESALVLFAQGVKPTIISTTHSEMPIEEVSDSLLYVSRMHAALDRALASLQKKTTLIPTKIYVALSSPWCMGQMRSIHYAKKTPFAFTAKLGNELIDTDTGRFVEGLRESFEGEALSVLDTTIVETKMNGYTVTSPIGAKGREVEMLTYASVIPKSIQSALRHSIERHYRAPIGFFSYSLASYVATRDMTLDKHGSYLLLTIENELSELALVERDVLRGSSTFPLGKNFLLRTLMAELQQSPLETISLLTLCKEGRAHEKVATRISRILEVVELEWKAGLVRAIHSLSGAFTLPSTLIIVGAADTASWFLKMAEAEEYGKGSGASKAMTVSLLDTSSIKKMLHNEENKDIDRSLALSTIYISRLSVV